MMEQKLVKHQKLLAESLKRFGFKSGNDYEYLTIASHLNDALSEK